MLYPVMLDVEGVAVLVVGAGRVAAGKVAGLAACGAVVTVVAPEVHPDVVAAGPARIHRRAYERGDLDGMRLVVTATGVREVDAAVHADATSAGIWVNSADDPERCSFILPAVVRRGPVIVSVSTSGRSPALARHLRDRIAEQLPPGVDRAAELLAEERRRVQDAGVSTESLPWAEAVAGALAQAAREAGAAG